MPEKSPYHGPALFGYGFRPFFLAACLFGLGAVPVWILVWHGDLRLSGPFEGVDWHVHEMLFGYAAAVIAGFLFTAVPNWTGRLPLRGWPLVGLLALWLLGRLAVAGAVPLPWWAVMILDSLFLLAISAAIGREIIAARNRKNLRVVIPVSLLFAANVLFHLEVALTGSSGHGRRLGFAVVVFLVMLIGGRIIPSFTRNWLAQRGAPRLPAPFGRFDALCMAAGGAALLAWVAAPAAVLTALLLAAAGLLHIARLARWRGGATLASPLLLMLHVAYAFVPAGLLATAAFGAGNPAMGLHLWGIGAIGGMTVAVMMRATRGHTGRSLVAGPWLTAAFWMIVAAALVRGLLPGTEAAGLDGITLSALLWTLGFGILSVRIAPWLALPSPARRTPSRHPG